MLATATDIDVGTDTATDLTVSVVIPCHNYGRFLGDAIDAALSQSHVPLEVLVIDLSEVARSNTAAREYRLDDRIVQTPHVGSRLRTTHVGHVPPYTPLGPPAAAHPVFLPV